jgi:hypothetical protein
MDSASVRSTTRRRPTLNRSDAADTMHLGHDARLRPLHRRGGNVLVAVDDEWIGTPTADWAHVAASLVIGSMNFFVMRASLLRPVTEGVCVLSHVKAPTKA